MERNSFRIAIVLVSLVACVINAGERRRAAKRVKLDLNSVDSRTFPTTFLNQGDTLNMNFDNISKKRANDRRVSYNCNFMRYDLLLTPCDQLPGTASFNIKSGQLSWTPGSLAYGMFFFEVTGTLKKATDKETFTVDVRELFPLAGLTANYDAQYIPVDLTAWFDLFAIAANAVLSGTSTLFRGGNGTANDPVHLRLDEGGMIRFPAELTSMNYSMDLWVRPNSSNSATLLSGPIELTQDSSGGLTFGSNTNAGDGDWNNSAPIAHWKLHPSETGIIKDLSGHGLDLMIQGNIEVSSQQRGDNASAHFNGAGFMVVNSDQFGPGNRAWSLEAWIRSDPSTQHRIIASWYEGSSTYILAIEESGNLYFLMRDEREVAGIARTSFRIDDSTWHHVAATYDHSAIKLYMDGVVAAVSEGTTLGSIFFPPPTVPIRFLIGSIWWGHAELSRPYFGDIDQVAVYDHALTIEEISAHLMPPKPCVTDSLSRSQWAMLTTLTRDKHTDLFIDGNFQCASDTRIVDPLVPLVIGGGSNSWVGAIGDVKFYEFRSEPSIEESFNATRARFGR